MTTQEVADKLVTLCKKGDWNAAHDQLYATRAVSIEPAGSPWEERTEGLAAIKAKGVQFDEMVEEMHELTVEGPIVGGNYFTCNMVLDVTFKGQPRNKSGEICLYKVEDGKIVSEQFFS